MIKSQVQRFFDATVASARVRGNESACGSDFDECQPITLLAIFLRRTAPHLLVGDPTVRAASLSVSNSPLNTHTNQIVSLLSSLFLQLLHQHLTVPADFCTLSSVQVDSFKKLLLGRSTGYQSTVVVRN